MGSQKNRLTDAELSSKGYDETEEEVRGICEVCNTEYYYYHYRDETPGFRENIRTVRPCKCGKYYGKGR